MPTRPTRSSSPQAAEAESSPAPARVPLTRTKQLQAQRDDLYRDSRQAPEELAAVKGPPNQLTPREFQDHLRDAVTKFTKDAEGKMALPKTFYMGFDRYQSAPPTDEAAPLLGRELKEVLAVLNTLLDARVTELRRFERDELPEEGGKAAKAPADAAKPAPSGGGKKGRGSDFLHKRGMDMTFTAEQPSFQTLVDRHRAPRHTSLSLDTSRSTIRIPSRRRRKRRGLPLPRPFLRHRRQVRRRLLLLPQAHRRVHCRARPRARWSQKSSSVRNSSR